MQTKQVEEKDKKAGWNTGRILRIMIFSSLLAAIIFAGLMVVYNLYIHNYNKGNESYEAGDYKTAESFYEKALRCIVPKGKECDIRVNLVLSKMYQTRVRELENFDKLPEEEAKAAWEEIEKIANESLEILEKVGCATEEGEGHDEEAQKLYDEIKELLESQSSSGGSGDDNNPEQNQQPQEGSAGNQDLEAIEQIMQQSTEERIEYQQNDANWNGDHSEWYDYYGDPW